MSNCKWCVVCEIDESCTGPFDSVEDAEQWVIDDSVEDDRDAYKVWAFYSID
jgi:hypothetical protein